MDGQLEVDVISGFDLPGRDLYLKLQLDLLVRKTSVKVNKKGSLTEWNQKLVFNVPDISGYTVLRVMLMERNTFYSDNLLAGVEVPLDSVSHGRMCVQDYGLTQQKGGGLHTLQLGLCWRGRDMERKNRDAQAKNQSEKQHTPERKNSVRTEETLRRVSNMSGAQVQKMTGSHKQNEHLAAKKTGTCRFIRTADDIFDGLGEEFYWFKGPPNPLGGTQQKESSIRNHRLTGEIVTRFE